MNTTPELHCDVLIIGSGAAGLSLALRLAEHQNVIVLSKGPISEGSTFYAQGGIAAVFDETYRRSPPHLLASRSACLPADRDIDRVASLMPGRCPPDREGRWYRRSQD